MRLALEHVVSAQREPHDSAHLFLNVAFIAQFGDCHARQQGIDCLPRQGHKFLRVVLIVLGQSKKEFALDRRALHLIFSGSSVPLRKSSRNGTSVGSRVTLVECTNAASVRWMFKQKEVTGQCSTWNVLQAFSRSRRRLLQS